MIRTLWFFVKMAVIIGACVWLATRSGEVSLNLLGYHFELHAGLFLITLAVLFATTLFIYRIFLVLKSVPSVITQHQAKDRHKKGYQALTRGLVAVAAGDAKKATQFSKQTQSLLPGENGLPILLEAQAARLRGEEGLAQHRFQELMKDKDAAFLGIRGLLKSALDNGNLPLALDYARQAQKLHPQKEWILKTVYDLEIRNYLWSDALETGKLILKTTAQPDDQILSDQIAIHLMRADYEQAEGDDKLAVKELDRAYKLDPAFAPTVTRLVKRAINNNKKRKAAAMVEKAWKENPHPELLELWEQLSPPRNDKSNKYLRWFEDLVKWRPDSAESQIAAAKAAMDLSLWGEAKSYLMAAEKIEPSARVFRLRAIAEQNSTHNEKEVQGLIEQASEAMPNKKWVCRETGMTYSEWSAIATPHESFNTIVWDYPGARVSRWKPAMIMQDTPNSLLIDPAA